MTNLEKIDLIQKEMHLFDKGSPERIQHFTKVHSFAAQIGRGEKLDDHTQFILELTTLVHDIGIRPATEKHGYCNGKLQEEIGPSYAREILEKIHISLEDIDRICYLVANHHTYDKVDGLDYRILLEADFLVNLYENASPQEAVLSALDHIFQTKTGITLCKTMFAIDIDDVEE